jgi:5-methyltetrahydrofolate--homocysteine methyltransferase
MKLGGKPGELKDLWNLDSPDKVLQVARSYVDAGARVILTNTFSSNRIVLAAHGAGPLAAQVNRAGAEISRRAAAGKAWVFGSMGPTGKMVSLGDLSPEEAEEAFAEQASALEAGGADGIVVETQADLEEARAALRACRHASRLPFGVTFTFDSGKDRTRTMMGVTVAQALDLAVSEGASFVGANCGVGIDAYVAVAKLFAEGGKDLPIWIKGNAGKPEPGPGGSTAYRATPEVFAAAVEPLLAAGARFIGGCCGSTPDHIRVVAAMLDRVA